MADEEQNLSVPRAVEAPVLTPESAIEWRLITDDGATHHVEITHDRAWVTWLPSVTTFGSYDAVPEVNAQAQLFASAPDTLAEFQALYRAYVNLLEIGRDRIVALGGDCDPVDRMEEGDPALIKARAAIAQATGEGR